MRVKLYAPLKVDERLGTFFHHEKTCPLCHSKEGGILFPHPDCKSGKEAWKISVNRSRKYQKGK
jgi:hypothetical protein